MVSATAAYRSAGTPEEMTALKIRAPSTWIRSPWPRATAEVFSMRSIGITRPPERLWVFSHTMSPMRGKKPVISIALSTSSGSMRPPSPLTVRKPTPERACGAPPSMLRTWLPSWASTSSPGWVWAMIESWFPIVPVGT